MILLQQFFSEATLEFVRNVGLLIKQNNFLETFSNIYRIEATM